MSIRPAIGTSQAQATMKGAGVHLHRAFGFQDPSAQDPFLLLDDFRNDDPRAYERCFPWHPHRGSRRSPMYWKAWLSIPTAWATPATCAQATSSG